MFRSTVRNFCYARPLVNSTQRVSPQSPRFSTTPTTSTPRSPALTPPDHLDSKELHIFNKLVTKLSPSRLEVRRISDIDCFLGSSRCEVQDVSGGCGTLYDIEIASRSFKGLPIVNQHRLVQEVLSEEIKGWHGVQLRTTIE